MSTPEDDFVRHAKVMTDGGFILNPAPFARLASWNRVLLHLYAASHYLKVLQGRTPKLGDLDDALDEKAYFSAFLIEYAKVFVSAGGHTVTLDARDVFREQSQARATHDRMMHLRHTYIAHSGDSDLVRDTIAIKETEETFFLRHLVTTTMPRNEFEAYETVVEIVSQHVTMQLDRRLNKLEQKLGKTVIPE